MAPLLNSKGWGSILGLEVRLNWINLFNLNGGQCESWSKSQISRYKFYPTKVESKVVTALFPFSTDSRLCPESSLVFSFSKNNNNNNNNFQLDQGLKSLTWYSILVYTLCRLCRLCKLCPRLSLHGTSSKWIWPKIPNRTWLFVPCLVWILELQKKLVQFWNHSDWMLFATEPQLRIRYIKLKGSSSIESFKKNIRKKDLTSLLNNNNSCCNLRNS